MDDHKHKILLDIQDILSGEEWSPDTAEQIAELMNDNGYAIEDIDKNILGINTGGRVKWD